MTYNDIKINYIYRDNIKDGYMLWTCLSEDTAEEIKELRCVYSTGEHLYELGEASSTQTYDNVTEFGAAADYPEYFL